MDKVLKKLGRGFVLVYLTCFVAAMLGVGDFRAHSLFVLV